MSRWATVIVALLVASALGTSSLAGCMAGPAAVPQAQMACCKNGHDTCPMRRATARSAAACCQHERQRQERLTAAEQQPVHTSTFALEQIAAVTPHTALPVAPEATTSARYSSRSTSPPTPRTSLSTVLLI